MRVKIRGLRGPDEACQAALWGADYIGLALAPGPYQVSLETARLVIKNLPPTTQPVLEWPRASVDEIVAALDTTACAWFQVEGRRPPAFLRQLTHQRPWVHLIVSWEVVSPQAGAQLAAYLQQVWQTGVRLDAVVLDAPRGGPHPGFERLGDISLSCRSRPPEIWCGGGLSAANVATALAAGHYDGVEASISLATSRAPESLTVLQQFIAAAKGS